MQKIRVPCIKPSLTSTYRAYGIFLGMLMLIFNGQSLLAQSQSYGESSREELVERLDSLANANINEGEIAGFSVAVFKGSDTLLLKGYGHADLGLAVPATEETRYRLVGPSTTILAALLMQQVERGSIALDQDITTYFPDFPWQGRAVTLRQLMDATSGLPDFHYLGDPFESKIAVPKSQDEVTALFAGLPFMHEPGERFQWTISGFHLAGILLERLTGRSFEELIEEEIVRSLGLKHTGYCNGREIVSGLATGYDWGGSMLLLAEPQSPSMYPFEASVCASAGDVAYFYRSLRQGNLIQSRSYQQMTTLSTAGKEFLKRNGKARAFGMFVGSMEEHPMFFEAGGLGIGYGSAAFDLPQEDLTVVVLQNTAGSDLSYDLGERLIAAVMGLTFPKAPAEEIASRSYKDLSITSEERDRYVGMYRVSMVDPSPKYSAYERTYRIYDENGRLMIQPVGQAPERLFKKEEQTFASESAPDMRVFFMMENGRATAISFQFNGHEIFKGPRIEEEGEKPEK